jgi:hypothetical protein
MKKWCIVAYPESGMPRKEAYVYATTHGAAIRKGFDMFPEYHEVGAYEAEEE